ncbi:MAG: hypothetical protein ACC657_10975 [Thiohalomonadales bacterium]
MSKIHFAMIRVVIITALFLGSYGFVSAAGKYENFNWVSPNGWTGAVFDVPTWFAKDMLYSGREVIRFHDGFYDEQSTGFWTYAFALMVEQSKQPTTQELLEETKRYFVGLARGIGDKNIKDYPAEKIRVTTKSDWKTSDSSQYQSQLFFLESYDPFTTGKPIKLNVKITTWPCSESYWAIHYTISPHPMSHTIWNLLDKEVKALKCW